MLLKLSWRNLWRNRRRTLLTILAIFLSQFFLILTLEVYDAMIVQSIENSLNRFYGHARVGKRAFFQEFDLNATISIDSLPEKIVRDPMVQSYSPRLITYALISSGNETYGVQIIAIDTGMEFKTTRIKESLLRGWFLRGDYNPVLVSEPISRLLNADVNDTVFIVGSGPDGSLYAENLIISGIFQTGSPSVDAGTVIMRLGDLQRILGLEGRAHIFVLRLKNPMKALQWKKKVNIQGLQIQIQVWQEWMKGVWEVLRYWNSSKILFGLIFYLAVVLIALNTMMMAFHERRREFAVIIALGMKRKMLFFSVLMEGIIMGLLSITVSLPVSYLAALILKKFPIDLSSLISTVSWSGMYIKPEISAVLNPFNFIAPSILLLILILISSILVSVRVFRIDVSRIIRERMI